MSVLDRAALEASPLADLHAIASELSIDGYRRLRRPELIDAILGRQAGEEPEAAVDGDEPVAAVDTEEEEESPSRRRRGRRGGRGRGAAREEAKPEEPEQPQEETAPEEQPAAAEEEIVEGVVELLPNGSGFVRVAFPEPSDDDVYISAAQVKRCELVSGDRISGPRRAPRRSERFASLVRIDTINERPADEVADSTRFDDLPAAFPSEPFRFHSDDPTLVAIERLAPIGRGSRVTIVGASRAGKTEALRRLASALAGDETLQVSVALAGVRPEEIPEWSGPIAPTAAVSIAASPDAQDHIVELVVDQARRIAARGANAVVVIDSLEGVHQHAARKALAAARNIVDGGSLTVIATAPAPIGGETTVIAFDRTLAASLGRFAAIDAVASGTMRAEALVGEAGAEEIVRLRTEVYEVQRGQ